MKASLALPTCAAVALAALFVALPLQAAVNPPLPGTILTVAGTGKPAFSGDGGAATQAALNYPYGIAFDAASDLFIACGNADGGIGNRVRRIDPAGIITTIAGSGKFAFSGDGGPATSAGMAP